MGSRLVLAVVVAALAVSAAGCGGKDESPLTSWADGVCSAFGTWKDSITSVKLTGLGANGASDVLDQIRTANDTLRTDLSSLERPESDAVQQAQTELSDLQAELSVDLGQIQQSFAEALSLSQLATAATQAVSTLGTMKEQVSSTLDQIRGLDAKGELKSAFEDAKSCDQLSSGS